MLSYLPEIYPEELLYSYIARTIRHTGFLEHVVLNRFHDSNTRVYTSTTMPVRVDFIAKCFPPERKITSDLLLKKHTLYPYFASYMNGYQESVVKSFSVGARLNRRTNSINKFLPARIDKSNNHLQYCVACHDEMQHEHGELYWIREHQLPYVSVCARHRHPLNSSTVPVSTKYCHRFEPPTSSNCCGDQPQYGAYNYPENFKIHLDFAERCRCLLFEKPYDLLCSFDIDYRIQQILNAGIASGITSVRSDFQENMRRFSNGIIAQHIFNHYIDTYCASSPYNFPYHNILFQMLVDYNRSPADILSGT